MHFSRLRLSGFKSFVDATDFRIEPGLTGVVGPNGCGKSNLLEALRWVMGAASAKAMRGEGMDDVIFSGTGARPARNQAEVTLTIDNADRTAPARFNAEPVLEVARRIDRGEGSTYRINGAEVRARDVQLLFADASTGANSPALVRQGQISELIAAKPQNRRRILEEAAGISGLHGRRHEAQLRVKAAQINLARLDDLARELEANLARLRREARQAEKYRKLAAQIRALQSIALYGRWMEARGGLERVEAEAGEAGESALACGRAAAAASAIALKAEAAIKPLRDEETAAAAVLHRLAIEKDRLERELQGAAAEVARRVAEIARIDTDAAREGQIVEDAGRALARLEAETGQMEAEIAAAPQRLPQLRDEAQTAELARARAQAAVETLASRAAALEAERTGAGARCEDARGRLSRTERALAQARSERAALGEAADPRLARATADRATAQRAMDLAKRALEETETAAGQAVVAEADARAAAREAEDALGRLLAESRGLAQLAAGADGAGGFAAALDSVAPDPGLEAALAAAMGDDLDAALDRRAPAYWGGGEAAAPAWPAGATPLAPMIAAPPQLAARLAFTALVEAADGERLQATLPPGARLVSRQGDLWRWDGYTAKAQARRPAQVRLEQKARLAALDAEVARKSPQAEAAKTAHAQAAATRALAETAVGAARAAAREGEAAAALAREALERVEREGVRRDAQAASLDETIARFEAERAEAQGSLADALAADAAAHGGDEDLAGALAQARDAATLAREAAATARAALDIEVRDHETRRARLEALRVERTDWSSRAGAASLRQTDLAKDRAKAEAALAAARQAPEAAQARRAALLDDLGAAEARRTKSADAREARASVAARLDAARDRLADAARELTATTRLTPMALGEQLLREGGGVLPASGEAPDLAALEREREAIGPVNLRAEEEAGELAVRVAGLRAERADLAGALGRLGAAIGELNSEGRERLNAAFAVIDGHFRALFTTLFEGGQAELRLVESDDPLEAGLEIYACPPGKRMAVMSLMSGGEQALTAVALIFAVFLANPAPICVLDEVDAPLDDANVDRFCNLLNAMRARAPTRFVAITHNPLTMSRMDRLFGVTMSERGVSQLVSVDLRQAETLAAQ